MVTEGDGDGVNVVVVFAMSATPTVNPTFVALCHFVTLPVAPDKVKAVTAPPAQMVWLPVTEPPAEAGVTVTINEAVVAEGQLPLATTALK